MLHDKLGDVLTIPLNIAGVDFPIIATIAVNVASVTIRAEDIAVVIARGAVLAGKDLETQSLISDESQAAQSVRVLSYAVLLAGSRVVRDVGHVARVSEDDNRNHYSNQLIWPSSRIYDM